MRLITILFVIALPILGTTQERGPSGQWSLDAEGAEGDGWKLSPIHGTLSLEQNGDKITGSWIGPFKENVWKLEGTIKDASFDVQSDQRDIPVTRDGVTTMEPARWVFKGKASGDTMTGMMALDRGPSALREQAFSATRTR
jgi:hypothetical protein